jgi:hypothetical protein
LFCEDEKRTVRGIGDGILIGDVLIGKYDDRYLSIAEVAVEG